MQVPMVVRLVNMLIIVILKSSRVCTLVGIIIVNPMCIVFFFPLAMGCGACAPSVVRQTKKRNDLHHHPGNYFFPIDIVLHMCA